MAALRLGKAEWTQTVEKIYHLLGDQPVTTSRHELAATIDEPVRAIQSFLAVARHLRILDLTYVQAPSGQGRASRYQLVVPLDEALRRLEQFGWENITSFKGEAAPRAPRVAAASRPTGEPQIRAIVGEEAPSPFAVLRPLRFNESAAQVEAARQYRDRVAFINEELHRFEEKGIKVDRTAFRVPTDPRLDAISLTLPYIEGLEKQVENLSSRLKRVGDVAQLRQQLEETQTALKRCQEARKGQVSARVLQEIESSRPD